MLPNVARDEWGIPIRENPLAKLQFKATDQRRERRLRPGELDKIIQAAEFLPEQVNPFHHPLRPGNRNAAGRDTGG